MNWQGCGRRRYVRLGRVPAGTRTEHFLNSNPNRYGYASSLGNVVFYVCVYNRSRHYTKRTASSLNKTTKVRAVPVTLLAIQPGTHCMSDGLYGKPR
jgi:hypothetical protein